jgi:RNA polymerase sigma-70 factor, ECF subfamily
VYRQPDRVRIRVVNEPGSPSIHGRVQGKHRFVEMHAEYEPPVTERDFDELFLDVHDRLYRALYFVTGNSHDAEELMQDAFLKLWERWDSIETIDDPTAYLFRTAFNAFRMRARRARLAARNFLLMPPPRDDFEEIDLRQDVRRLLLALPTRQRAALVLTEIFGYSSEQASRILGIGPASVRVLASRGRATLRGAVRA